MLGRGVVVAPRIREEVRGRLEERGRGTDGCDELRAALAIYREGVVDELHHVATTGAETLIGWLQVTSSGGVCLLDSSESRESTLTPDVAVRDRGGARIWHARGLAGRGVGQDRVVNLVVAARTRTSRCLCSTRRLGGQCGQVDLSDLRKRQCEDRRLYHARDTSGRGRSELAGTGHTGQAGP